MFLHRNFITRLSCKTVPLSARHGARHNGFKYMFACGLPITIWCKLWRICNC